MNAETLRRLAATLPNHYAVLNAHAQMSDYELRTAYRTAARAAHPDRGGDPSTFRRVTAAYAAVKDAALRARYAARCALAAGPCKTCGGSGVRTTTRSFRETVRAPCSDCGGCGYAIEK